MAASWTAGADRPLPAEALGARPTPTLVVPDHGDAAASRSASRETGDPTPAPDLTRADTAWGQRLTAAAEAWFRAHPPAPVAPATPPAAVPPQPPAAPTPTPPPAPPAPEPSPTPSTPAPSTPPPAAPPVTPAPPAPPAAPAPPATSESDYRAAAEAFLDTLPGGASATIEWGDPDGHLGGVWIPGSETIILNATRLDGRLAQTKDVLRHEIGHVHQNRTMAATGMSLTDYEARLNALFGKQGIERSADAVAMLLGASSVRYASSFSDAQYAAARAILEDRVP